MRRVFVLLACVCALVCAAHASSSSSASASSPRKWFVVASSPALGHAIPAASVAAELARRGHRVDFVIERRPELPTGIEPILAQCRILWIDSEAEMCEAERSLRTPFGWTDKTESETVALALQIFDAYSQTASRYVRAMLADAVVNGDALPDYAVVDFILQPLLIDFQSAGVHAATVQSSVPFAPLQTYSSWVPAMVQSHSAIHATPLQRLQSTLLRWTMFAGLVAYRDLGIELLPNFRPVPRVYHDNVLSIFGVTPGFDYPQLMPPLVHFVGALLPDESLTPPLDSDVRALLDGAGRGVVYISFGTVVHVNATLGAELMDATARLSRDLGVRVLWAIKSKDVEHLRKTVPEHLAALEASGAMLRSWVPTPRVLAHQNLRMFVTHCGGGGTTQSLHLGKPMLGLPVNTDQPVNCIRAQDAGAALCTSPKATSADELYDLGRRILTDESFTANAKRIGVMSRALGGARRAADLVEMCATDGACAKMSLARIPLAFRLDLDEYAMIAAFVAFAVLLVRAIRKTGWGRRICCCCCCCCC